MRNCETPVTRLRTLLVAGAVTLELMVLLGEPLNFANVIALPLLLGVGVAFKIYYIMAWRAGRTNLLQSTLTRAVFFQRADDGDGVRQPMALRPAGHFEHGQAHGLGAGLHAGRRGSVPAGPDGRRAATTPGTWHEGLGALMAKTTDLVVKARADRAKPARTISIV